MLSFWFLRRFILICFCQICFIAASKHFWKWYFVDFFFYKTWDNTTAFYAGAINVTDEWVLILQRPYSRDEEMVTSPSLQSMQMQQQQHAANALMQQQNAAELQQKHLQMMMQGRMMGGNNQCSRPPPPAANHPFHHQQQGLPPGIRHNIQQLAGYGPQFQDGGSRLGHGFPSSHMPTGEYLNQYVGNGQTRDMINSNRPNLPFPG